MGKTKKPKDANKVSKHQEAEEYIFPRYITRNGKRIYPKNAKTFRIPVSSLKD
ncbi:MAG: hypothetical protein K2M46_06390 [Lachnospiraceae bacterium]|nr:hypothetical protein [Lachnospiraceae bacterium]